MKGPLRFPEVDLVADEYDGDVGFEIVELSLPMQLARGERVAPLNGKHQQKDICLWV